MSRPVLIRFQRMYKSVNLSVESGIHQDDSYVTDVSKITLPPTQICATHTVRVTPHIPLSDDVTSRPSPNISIRSRTAAVKSSYFHSPSPSPTRLKSVKAMKFKAHNPTLNFFRSHVKLSRSASPIRDHPETTCQVVQTTGDSDSVDKR